MRTLIAGGLEHLSLRIPAAQRYSFVFDGQSGELDHALATPSLAARVRGITPWHINADEPSVLDYNTELQDGRPLRAHAVPLERPRSPAHRNRVSYRRTSSKLWATG